MSKHALSWWFRGGGEQTVCQTETLESDSCKTGTQHEQTGSVRYGHKHRVAETREGLHVSLNWASPAPKSSELSEVVRGGCV